MGTNPAEFHPEALAEAEAALAWYAERSPRAAEEFLTELERAVKAIAEAPERWPLFDEGCRRFPLHRFPYFVVYRKKGNSVEVIAVAHGRRRPGIGDSELRYEFSLSPGGRGAERTTSPLQGAGVQVGFRAKREALLKSR